MQGKNKHSKLMVVSETEEKQLKEHYASTSGFLQTSCPFPESIGKICGAEQSIARLKTTLVRNNFIAVWHLANTRQHSPTLANTRGLK
jgi:hypothetical protein